MILSEKRILGVLISVLFFFYTTEAKTVYDAPNGKVHGLFSLKGTKYVIRYKHCFSDTLRIPRDCKIEFRGGALIGPIIFNQTELLGKVNLIGSSIRGTITNKKFDASWLCYRNGEYDDARSINDIISMVSYVFFPKGKYMLISKYNVPRGLPGRINAHIGINRSNKLLEGENGTVFMTNEPLGCICVFSYPNQISNSTGNISIKGITFEVHNDGNSFFEFMHTIRTIGVNGLVIEQCHFNDFWGDAICLSTYDDTPETGERTRNQNVTIKNNIIIGGKHHSNRNGISVVNGKNVLITGNIIRNTSRKNMPGGIDVEPNNSAYTIEDICIERNNLDGIWGSNGAISVVSFKDGPVHNISITDNKITNSTCGLFFYLKTKGTTSGYTIKGNYTDEKTVPYRFVGSGSSMNWCVTGNHFERICSQPIPGDIKVENLKVRKNKIATDGK